MKDWDLFKNCIINNDNKTKELSEELYELKALLRQYFTMNSLDGKSERQVLRKKLKELVKE